VVARPYDFDVLSWSLGRAAALQEVDIDSRDLIQQPLLDKYIRLLFFGIWSYNAEYAATALIPPKAYILLVPTWANKELNPTQDESNPTLSYLLAHITMQLGAMLPLAAGSTAIKSLDVSEVDPCHAIIPLLLPPQHSSDVNGHRQLALKLMGDHRRNEAIARRGGSEPDKVENLYSTLFEIVKHLGEFAHPMRGDTVYFASYLQKQIERMDREGKPRVT
jgi:hypothetical protein